MHGRPRDYKQKLKDPKAAEAHARKVAAIKQGTTLVLECRRQHRYDPAALKASEKLLRVVPEIYTIWNYRREALEPVFAAGGEAAAAASEQELALTQACLLENPKSYSTWHHRKWVVLKGHADLQREMKLVNSALAVDGRNFHAWNYRQFMVKLLGLATEGELAYTTSCIAADFSNYSAWHYRTLLLHRLHNEDITTVSFADLMSSAGGSKTQPQQEQPQQQEHSSSSQRAAGQDAAGRPDQPKQQQQQQQRQALVGSFRGSASQVAPVPLHVLDQEYDMVHQAFATDSGDESPWIYYRWLLGNSLAHLQRAQQQAAAGGGGSSGSTPPGEAVREAQAVLSEVLAREVARFAEALEQDPDARWPLLMTARLKEAQASLGDAWPEGEGQEGAQGAGLLQPAALRRQAGDLYRRLAALDPMRAGYYADAAAGKAFVVVQALGTV